MLIYRCDACGLEKQFDQIIGNEFKHVDCEFGTLGIKVDGMRDLCKSCMKKAEAIYSEKKREFDDQRDTAVNLAVAQALRSAA